MSGSRSDDEQFPDQGTRAEHPKNELNADASRLTLEMQEFIEVVSRRILAGYPVVRRHNETPDIAQNASLKLFRALQEVEPQTRRHLENLAATQIRRTVIDLARKYAKAHNSGLTQWTPHTQDGDSVAFLQQQGGQGGEPEHLLRWAELHEQVDQLPEEQREVFQLTWYRGLSRAEVAELLDVDIRTVQRRWFEARMTLSRKIDPEIMKSL